MIELPVVKLKYNSREAAQADLVAKGVIDANGDNLPGTHAKVDVYKYDADNTIIDDGVYRVDIITEQEIDFGQARVIPTVELHDFMK